MTKKNQHIIPKKDGKWGVKKAGSTKVTGIYSTKKEAISVGKSFAKNQKSALIVHDKTGKIQTKKSFSDTQKIRKEKK